MSRKDTILFKKNKKTYDPFVSFIIKKNKLTLRYYYFENAKHVVFKRYKLYSNIKYTYVQKYTIWITIQNSTISKLPTNNTKLLLPKNGKICLYTSYQHYIKVNYRLRVRLF